MKNIIRKNFYYFIFLMNMCISHAAVEIEEVTADFSIASIGAAVGAGSFGGAATSTIIIVGASVIGVAALSPPLVIAGIVTGAIAGAGAAGMAAVNTKTTWEGVRIGAIYGPMGGALVMSPYLPLTAIPTTAAVIGAGIFLNKS